MNAARDNGLMAYTSRIDTLQPRAPTSIGIAAVAVHISYVRIVCFHSIVWCIYNKHSRTQTTIYKERCI